METTHEGRPVRQHVISGLLIVVALLLTVAALFKESATAHRSAILIDFYPVERNESGEYRFTRPTSHILIPPLSSDAVLLSFRTYSPRPLPERILTLRLDERTSVSLPSGPLPRRLMFVLSPTGAGTGQLLTLETTPARVPPDSRLLGIFTDTITLRALNPQTWQQLALIALAPVTALFLLLVMRSGILAGACGAGIVAGVGLWGWTIAWSATLGIGAALVFDRMLHLWTRHSLLSRINSALHRLAPPDIVVGSLTFVWISVVGWGSLALHQRYATGAYDLGLFDQWLWLISRGLPPYSTGVGVHLLGDHAAVLLYPLAALYLVAPDVRVLLIVQSLVVGIGGLTLYRIGCIRGSAWMGALVAGAYLIHPSTHNMALFHFHPDALAATAVLVILWGIEQHNPAVIGAAAIAVCAAKENFAITTGWLGAWLFVRGERRWGSALILGSLAWFSLAAFLIQPAHNGQPQSVFAVRFAHYGATPRDIILTILQRPDLLILDLLQPENLRYLTLVLAPIGMLPFLSPSRAVLAMPALALNMLSNYDAQRALVFHYDALTVALLSYAGLDAAIAIQHRLRELRISLLACTLCLTLGATWTASAVPLRIQDAWFPPARDVELSFVRHYILARIPRDSAVSASQALHPHLTHRRQAFVFPNPFVPVNYVHPAGAPQPPSVEFIVHDTHGMGSATANREQELLRELERRGLFAPVMRVGAIVLMKRTDAPLPDFCFGTEWHNMVCRPNM